MSQPADPAPKSPSTHLHSMNLVVALLAGIISITGGIYSLKNNLFSGPALGSIQGIVRDEKIAKPLKLATVEISAVDGAVVNTATTDDDGHYLIESIKAGNYVVKFTATFHKPETKTIKIEKDLASTISADLIPDEQQMKAALNVPEIVTRQNIPAPYGASGVQSPMAVAPYSGVAQNASQGYSQAPASPQYGSAQSASQGYSQVPQPADVPRYGAQNQGYRRHQRHYYSNAPVDNTTGVSQNTSQSSGLAEAGTQLLQALMSKKSDSSTTTSSN